jgi:hypothetical protein
MRDVDEVLRTLGVEEVEDEELERRLEERRHGGRESSIRTFLTTAPLNKWFKINFNVGAVYREAKKMNIKVKATVLNGERYVKVIERP